MVLTTVLMSYSEALPVDPASFLPGHGENTYDDGDTVNAQQGGSHDEPPTGSFSDFSNLLPGGTVGGMAENGGDFDISALSGDQKGQSVVPAAQPNFSNLLAWIKIY